MRILMFLLIFLWGFEIQGQIVTHLDKADYAPYFQEVLKFHNSQLLAKPILCLPDTIPYLPSYLSAEKHISAVQKQTYSLCPNFYDYLMRLDPQLKPYLGLPELTGQGLIRQRVKDSLLFFMFDSTVVRIIGLDSVNLDIPFKQGIRALYVEGVDYIDKIPQVFREKALFSYPCHGLLKGPEVFFDMSNAYDETIVFIYLYAFDFPENEPEVNCLEYEVV